MRSEVTKKLFTVDEYDRMAEAGIFDPEARLELIEGEVLEMSPAGARHVACVNRATSLFARKLGDRAIISVQNPLRLTNDTESQPDLVLLRPRDDYYEGKRTSWEDALLVIEVSDTTIRHDRDRKLPLYAKAGVAEVWIEDLRRDLVLVYRDPGPNAYATSLTLQRGDSIALLAFPDVALKVEDLIG